MAFAEGAVMAVFLVLRLLPAAVRRAAAIGRALVFAAPAFGAARPVVAFVPALVTAMIAAFVFAGPAAASALAVFRETVHAAGGVLALAAFFGALPSAALAVSMIFHGNLP